MVVFSHFVLLLCTFWELWARFLIYIFCFLLIKKKKISHIDFHENSDKIGTIESLRNLLIVE